MSTIIKNLEDVSYSKTKYVEVLQEFYYYIIDSHLKFLNLGEGKKCDPKLRYKTFTDYFRRCLFEGIHGKYSKFKLEPKTNVVILSKRYYEKNGFTLSFNMETFEILDFKHSMIKRTTDYNSTLIDGKSDEDFKDIVSIEKYQEGTNIILVVKNGEIINVRTQGTFNGETSYDIDKNTDTFYSLFFKTLDEKKLALSKFLELSKTKPDVKYCFNFLMKLNFTPFPILCDNDINLIALYEINDKSSDIVLFNKLLKELPQIDFEEKVEELKEFVKTELTSSYVNYFKIDDVISLFNNIGCGSIKGPQSYKNNKGLDTKDFIEYILSNQNPFEGEKGIIIRFSDGRYQEQLNIKYEYIISLRCSGSLEITPENERNLFNNLFLKLIFTKEKEEDRIKLFQDFYKLYDGETRTDGKQGQYSELFKKFYILIHEFSKIVFSLYEKHRIKTLLPLDRIEIDKSIPKCITYTRTNLIRIIHSHYQSEKQKESYNTTSRGAFKVDLKYIEVNIIFGVILKQTYESTINADPRHKNPFGDTYGRLLNPDMSIFE
jgi:hypothetical protein